jgi:DNA-binding GntR family transcriptional regulator
MSGREAFLRLGAKEIVTQTQRRGVIVRTSLTEKSSESTTCAALEGLAAQLSAKRTVIVPCPHP